MVPFILGACLLTVAGCLQPGPVDGDGREEDLPEFEDNGLRAGATSTTNWPPKAGNRYISIRSRADSALAIAFLQNGEAATDPLFVPVRLSGTASLYKAGTIPALREPRIATITFADADTIRFTPDVADSLLESGSDTLIFNIRIRTLDGLEGWSFCYGYLPRTGTFHQTGFSGEKENGVFLGKAEAYFQGRIDTSGAFSRQGHPGVTLMCFYIPGTHFFKPVEDNPLELGPLAAGDYPLRLLRITYPDVGGTESVLESFEVEMTDLKSGGGAIRFEPGARIFSRRIPSRVQLRPYP